MIKKILSDDAINSFEDDLLNRSSFVENLSNSPRYKSYVPIWA